MGACMPFGVTAPVAAESGVPGSTGGRAGLLAGQAQGDAVTADRLQKAGAGGRLLLTGVLLLAAETQTDEEAVALWGNRPRHTLQSTSSSCMILTA